MVAHERQIGPVGTVGRIAVGVLAIVVPIASAGIGWWEWATVNAFVLVAAAVARAIIAGYERYAPRAFASRHAICSLPGCSLVAALVGLSSAMSAITPADGDVVLGVWLGASMLVGAAAGYGGCEVLAFPNALTGRRDRIGCLLFTPIDAVETRYRSGASRRPLLGRGQRR